MGRVPVECSCGKNSKGVDVAVPDEFVSEKDGYVAGRCTGCGVIRTLEREEDYESLYTEGLRYHVEEMDKIGRDHYANRLDHDLELALTKRIPLLLGRMRCLDVGCANGAFVLGMKMYGFQAEGLELNPIVAGQAVEETDCPIWTSWDQVTGKFDVISYHDVIEHVVDPNAELARLRDHMRANALLILDCPDADEVFGEGARAGHHQKPDQHLFYYTEATLRALLARHGFLVDYVDRPIVGKLVVYSRKSGE